MNTIDILHEEIARLKAELATVTRERDDLRTVRTAQVHRYCPECFSKDVEIARLQALLANALIPCPECHGKSMSKMLRACQTCKGSPVHGYVAVKNS